MSASPYPGPTPNYAGPTSNYAEPTPNYAQPNSGYNPYEPGHFKPKKKITDPIFLILFILTFLGYLALSGYVLNTWVKSGGQSGTSVTLNRSTAWLLLFITAAGIVLSAIYLFLAMMFTRAFISITLVLTILLNIGICVYYWITKYWSGAIIFTIIAVLPVISYFVFRSRVPLSSLLLQVVMDVSKHHLSVYAVAFAALFLQAALSVWYAFTAVATYTKWTPGNPNCATNSCSSGKVAGLIFFETFAYLWIAQVIKNVAVATLAGGTYGTWYYYGPKKYGEWPKNSTMSSFGRNSTFTLGSIALGSLIVSILEQVLEIICLINIIRENIAADGHPVEVCLYCLCCCCTEYRVGCIRSSMTYLVGYFNLNRYAYVEIALYGKSYIPAAKNTLLLFKDRGLGPLFDDPLLGMTLTWGGYMIGLICSLFAYLYLRFTHPLYNATGNYTAPILLFSFLIGLQCSLTLLSAIEAGVSTIFVGLAEDPEVLAMRAPQLFGMIAARYPHVTSRGPRYSY